MSAKTSFVTRGLFNTRLSADTRDRILKILNEKLIFDRYASNIESSLRAVGENKLANRFLEELEK